MRPSPDENFDTPAYTRALTSLAEFRRRHALQDAARVDAENRTFNHHFWATLAGSAGAVPGDIGSGWWSQGVWAIVGRVPGGTSVPADPEFLRHRW